MPKILKRILLVLLALVLLAFIALGVYLCTPTKAQDTANQAVNSEGVWSNDGVQVVNREEQIAFIPQNPKAGLIFYPGIKIESKTYAPLLRNLAERGILCVAPTIPFNVSVFNVNAADGIQEQYPQVNTWYMAGHSLGGVSAAHYVANHPNQYKGLILIGAFLNADLSNTNLRLLQVDASYDQVKPMNKYLDMSDKSPADTTTVVVEGGNHSQFGDYRKYDADGDASISPEQQWTQTADFIANWVFKS